MNNENEIQNIEKLEKELIFNFLEKFYSKLGYYPVIISKNINGLQKFPVLDLTRLKSNFDELLPYKYGKIQKLDSKLRIRELVELRFIFTYLARKMGYKLNEISKHLNKRDHTTVLYNLKTFHNLYETSENFRIKYKKVINHLKEKYEPSTMDHFDEVECKSK